jgi:hypothetical protein
MSCNLGDKGWIKYGWGDLLDESQGNHKIMTIDLTNYIIDRSVSALDAALSTVEKITNSYPAPYTLMCSGGIDSQAMIWAWHLSGKPFEIISVKYISDGRIFNEHDLSGLQEYCTTLKHSINSIEFDLINFLENDLLEIAALSECTSPHLCTYMKMSEVVSEGTVLFSGSPILRTLPVGTKHTAISSPLQNTQLGMHRYGKVISTSTKQFIPFFFMHTAELAYAFTNSYTPNLNSYERKVTMYHHGGFPVIAQSMKFTGFEVIKEYYDNMAHRVSLSDRVQYAARPSKRVFDILFRHKNSIVMPKNATWKDICINKYINT